MFPCNHESGNALFLQGNMSMEHFSLFQKEGHSITSLWLFKSFPHRGWVHERVSREVMTFIERHSSEGFLTVVASDLLSKRVMLERRGEHCLS